MKKLIRKYIPILELINSLSEKEKKNFFKTSNIEIIRFLSDLLYNINSSNIFLEKETLLKLKKFKKDIKTISKKKTTLAQRRKILSKKGFFHGAISPLIKELIILVRNNEQLQKNVPS